jgi:FMN phosphatase YigB (HAD superfamily)
VARAESTVFVVDQPENIAAAQALGITGVWHQDNAATIQQLDQLLFGEG